MKNRIGFFLHIPWPPRRLMVSLPYHERLVESMFAYDVIGFQTEEWLESFRHYVDARAGRAVRCRTAPSRVGDRSVDAGAFPIGIDVRGIRRAATSAERAKRLRADARQRRPARTMIIGVDRLDYSKGLEERFLGYRPLPRGASEDCRASLPAPDRAALARRGRTPIEMIRERLDELSGRINGEFADVDWVPIRYVNQGYPRDELAGFYRAAEIAPGHAAARRHEPGRQGICRGAGSRRSRRADPVALRRRGAAVAARRCWSIRTARRRSRRDPAGARNAEGGADPALAGAP